MTIKKMQLERQLVELVNELTITDKLVKVGLGGSGLSSFNDLDVVIVQKKFDFVILRNFKRKAEILTQKKVSITPVDYYMLSDKNLWSSKFATMVYKSIDWVFGEWEFPMPSITLGELKNLIKRESPFFYNLWLKKLANEDNKEAKALELCLQEIALLID
jgi:hypothetical protein